MNWAWLQILPPVLKLVLMALADAANEEGICWPNVKTIANKCSISPRTVRRAIAELKFRGLLQIDIRYRSDGSQTSNNYQLMMADDKLSSGGGLSGQGALAKQASCLDLPGNPLTHIEPEENTPQQQACPNGSSDNEILPTLEADLIWEKVLVKNFSVDEQALMAGIVEPVPDMAQQILDEFAGRLKISQVKNPIGYLRRLVNLSLQGKLQPELALKVDKDRKRRVNIATALKESEYDVAGTVASGCHDRKKIDNYISDARLALQKRQGNDEKIP